MRNINLTILFIFGLSLNLNAQVLTDSTVAMIAFWSIGDVATYEFTETEDKLSKGIKTLKTTTCDLVMTIVDSTRSSYNIRWEYKNCKRDFELDQIEKDLIEICSGIPIQYKTDEFGVFDGIENWEEMGKAADVAFAKWMSDHVEMPDSLSLKMKNMISALFENEQQINYWARDLKFFHYLYGANLSRDLPFEGVKYYTNPFVQKKMAGMQRVEVIGVDEENLIARIEVEMGIAEEQAKELMIDFMRQNMDNLGIKDEGDIKKEEIPNYSVRENIDCIYDLESGYILEAISSKLTKLGEDYKTTTYEWKLKG